MFNAILLTLQFIMDYSILAMYMVFIVPFIFVVMPSSWLEGLRQSGAMHIDSIVIALALLLIVPALLSRFSLFQSILLYLQGARKAKGDELAYLEQVTIPVLNAAAIDRDAVVLYI
jgi:STE24 endopeptidase